MAKAEPPGLNKEYVITRTLPDGTVETQTVTQRQWRDQKLGQAGWEKPPDLEEVEPPEPTT